MARRRPAVEEHPRTAAPDLDSRMTPHRNLLTDATMSFGDHLDELRRRLLLCLLVPLPVAIVAFFFSDTLIRWMLLPLFRVLSEYGLAQRVTNLSPPEMLIVQFKISLILALILSAPWILWQAWLFVRPGLYHHERRFVHFMLPGSALLTLLGISLMYFAMLPIMLSVMVAAGVNVRVSGEAPPLDPRISKALEDSPTIVILVRPPASPIVGQAYVLWPDLDKPFISIVDAQGAVQTLSIPAPPRAVVAQEYRLSEYMDFVLLMFLAIAVAFQMPLVVVLMGWLGLASVEWLRSKRRYALFICGIVSAIITPSTDIVSMMVMLGPLYGLYELGILLLTLAPASRVAEGTILSWTRPKTSADNRPAQAAQTGTSTQMEGTIRRTEGVAQHSASAVDDEGTGP